MNALTTSAPIALRPSSIVEGWRWRTHNEGDVQPAAMETRHLHLTLRMIWNHTMPRHMQVGQNIRRYAFGHRHPPKFMREAIIQIGAELFRRDDIAPWMKRELDEMARWMGAVTARNFVEDGRALMLEHVA